MAERESARSLDLRLYLVIQRDGLQAGVSHEHALREALSGGVTIVQLREKTASTADFIALATRSKAICDEFDVPLLINDRIDVALAIGAAGVHDDMPLALVRKLLGPSAIIGVSANDAEQARLAVEGGADYLGIGPCYDTISKADAKGTLGPRGVAAVLESMGEAVCATVTIGGVNGGNLARVLHGATAPSGRRLDGVAVISAIIGSPDPRSRARELREIVDAAQALSPSLAPTTIDTIRTALPKLFEQTRSHGAVVQQITNTVVQTDSANMTIALGASPIMSSGADEAADLAPIIGALCINLGTLNAEQIAGMFAAGRLANQHRKPIIFDPVGADLPELLDHWQATVIKGNSGEIAHLAAVKGATSRGVDSSGSLADPAGVVKSLALKERCIVVATGRWDYVSDGTTTLRLGNGHARLGEITGSGCATGSCIGAMLASASALALADSTSPASLTSGDMLSATVAGLLAINIAAEIAAARPDVQGPGTFGRALIDEVARLRIDDVLERMVVEVC